MARFHFQLIAYLTTLGLIAAAAIGFGWRLGRRQGCPHKLSPVTAGIVLGAGILWLLTANFARSYADTDGSGAEIAEWFAHSGKWLTLLAAMLLGHGWILGARQSPPGVARRIFYYVALLGMVLLTVANTLPVYVLLGDGRRDETGRLRQSEKVEVTCGAVALLNYLELYQHHPVLTEREVARVCGVTLEGTTTSALVRAARHFGLTNAIARVLTRSELEKIRLPAIVSISTLPTVHHATLLIRLEAERADFIDPAYGNWSVSRTRFEAIWYGKTVRLE